MIRDENGKLAITPGKWGVDVNAFGQRTVWSEDHRPLAILTHPGSPNAALFAEAGTVTNECGKTPHELLDLCRDLHTSLAFFSKLVEGSMGLCGWHMHGGSVAWGDWQKELDAAESALAKSEGV